MQEFPPWARRVTPAGQVIVYLSSIVVGRHLSSLGKWEIQLFALGEIGTILALARTAAAIARDPRFLLPLVEPRALRWVRTALRVPR